MIVDHTELMTGPMWFILMVLVSGTFAPMLYTMLRTYETAVEEEKESEE